MKTPNSYRDVRAFRWLINVVVLASVLHATCGKLAGAIGAALYR